METTNTFTAPKSQKAFTANLKKVYGFYTGGFIVFCILLGIAEQMGLSRAMMGYVFLGATILLYAGIGIMSRTNDADEYYVAGRRVPAVFNGMATGADWMSAASFIGMAGGLYAGGYGGLAFIMGWTGGYVLVAMFLAPFLRKFGQFTIPDFLGARYGGNLPRFIGVAIAILCSFTYVVAQIYGVGLITTRLTGVTFELGVFLGLAGILVCSFLGGMKAVTWTQVAQYIILIIAYMIPVVWLSVKQTGFPIPQLVYGQQLMKVTELEKKITADPKEIEVRQIFKDRAAAANEKLKDVKASYAADKAVLEKRVAELTSAKAKDEAAIKAAISSLSTSMISSESVMESRLTRSLSREIIFSLVVTPTSEVIRTSSISRRRASSIVLPERSERSLPTNESRVFARPSLSLSKDSDSATPVSFCLILSKNPMKPLSVYPQR